MPSWSQSDEMHFINGLGYHRGSNFPTDAEIRETLLGYRRGLFLRTVWGELDREKTLAQVADRLSHLSKNEGDNT